MTILQKTKEALQENLVKMSLLGLIGLLGYPLTIVWAEISVPFLQKVLPQASNRALFAVASILSLILVVTFAVLIFTIKHLRPTLKPRFGILWDAEHNAYCPSCKTLLTNYSEYRRDTVGGTTFQDGFKCFNCKETVYLVDDVGNALTLFVARNLLKQKRK